MQEAKTFWEEIEDSTKEHGNKAGREAAEATLAMQMETRKVGDAIDRCEATVCGAQVSVNQCGD
eukprot:2959851-Heterocapsa_arctica.AAC.1